MEKAETISAISTPVGTGGISVIRISGERALSVSDKIFKGSISLGDAATHTVHVGTIVEPESHQPIDRGVATVFRAPHSFTGEDVVEISCHGGIFVTQKVLQATLRAGARMAEPGEFTKRAFLNGKLDLSQAEAVGDIIQAQTQKSLRVSYQQLSGNLLKRVQALQNELIDILGLLELGLDFSEEDIELTPKGDILSRMDSVMDVLEKIISSYQKGRFLHNGVKMTIVGCPNVGKSSLLNQLLGSDRAIVDSTPGTTRDALEAQLDIKGVLFRIIDTAGLREPHNRVEAKGIQIAQFHLEVADLVVFLFDASCGWKPEDDFVWEKIVDAREKNRAVILIVENKIDLKKNQVNSEVPENIRQLSPIRISAKTGEGLSDFYEAIEKQILADENLSNEEVVLTNVRHVEAMRKTISALEDARQTIKKEMSGDFVAVDIREALNALGEIVGETSPDDVLNHIFNRFCIGK